MKKRYFSDDTLNERNVDAAHFMATASANVSNCKVATVTIRNFHQSDQLITVRGRACFKPEK
jgi:hypothetical protein